jgi:hypothetical protein
MWCIKFLLPSFSNRSCAWSWTRKKIPNKTFIQHLRHPLVRLETKLNLSPRSNVFVHIWSTLLALVCVISHVGSTFFRMIIVAKTWKNSIRYDFFNILDCHPLEAPRQLSCFAGLWTDLITRSHSSRQTMELIIYVRPST